MTCPDRPRARIRIAGPGDPAALLRLKQRLDLQTAFMLLEPDERDTSVQALADDLGATVRSGKLSGDRGGVRRRASRVAHNHRAARLYERLGFSVEGRRRSAWSSTAGSSMSSTWPSSSNDLVRSWHRADNEANPWEAGRDR